MTFTRRMNSIGVKLAAMPTKHRNKLIRAYRAGACIALGVKRGHITIIKTKN